MILRLGGPESRIVWWKSRLNDRRGQVRFEIIGPLWGTLEMPQRLVLRNIGQGGALLEAPLPILLDTVHEVQLSFEGHVTNAQAQVRHVTKLTAAGEERYLIGFEFLRLPPETADQIERLIQAAGGGR